MSAGIQQAAVDLGAGPNGGSGWTEPLVVGLSAGRLQTLPPALFVTCDRPLAYRSGVTDHRNAAACRRR